MSPEIAELQRKTPMTQRYVNAELRRTGLPGLHYEQNVRAYGWRQFELRHPWFAKLCGLFVFGPRIALGL